MVYVNLTVRLPQMFETNYGRLVNAFRRNSPEIQPSLWWGAQLMSAYIPRSNQDKGH